MPSTRRQLLLRTSGVAGLAVAGCLGGGGSGGATTLTPAGGGGSVGKMKVPYRGKRDALVVVRSWEDFLCPHCREFEENVVPRLVAEYVSTGDVCFEHHDYPIPVAPRWSWSAAIAARSVQRNAGMEAFWTFAERLFADQREMGWSLVRSAATEAGADPDAVVSETRNRVYRGIVMADRTRGANVGVEATPGVFVDGNSVEPTYAAVSSAIDAKL